MARAHSGNKVKMSAFDRVVAVVPYVVVTLLCLLILLPSLNVVALSFNDGKDAARGGVYFWPRVWTLDNYREVFKDGSIVRAYRITIARTGLGTLMSLAFTFMIICNTDSGITFIKYNPELFYKIASMFSF